MTIDLDAIERDFVSPNSNAEPFHGRYLTMESALVALLAEVRLLRGGNRVTVRALPDGLTQCHNPRCGVWFLPKRSDALFCSKACGIMDLRRRKAEEIAPKA